MKNLTIVLASILLFSAITFKFASCGKQAIGANLPVQQDNLDLLLNTYDTTFVDPLNRQQCLDNQAFLDVAFDVYSKSVVNDLYSLHHPSPSVPDPIYNIEIKWMVHDYHLQISYGNGTIDDVIGEALNDLWFTPNFIVDMRRTRKGFRNPKIYFKQYIESDEPSIIIR